MAAMKQGPRASGAGQWLVAALLLLPGAWAQPLPADRFVTVDIGYACNRDHTAAPYYEAQPASYDWLKPGRLDVETTRGRVPFRVADPAAQGGHSLFVSRGQRNHFPVAVTFLVYARGVRAVHLLGLAGGWAQGPTGERVGTAVARYSDGTQREVPLRLGLEVDDWTAHRAQAAVLAAAAEKGGGGHVDAWRFDLEGETERTLAEIQVRAEGGRTSLPVFADTLELTADGGLLADALTPALADLRAQAAPCTRAVETLRQHGFDLEADGFAVRLAQVLEGAPNATAAAGLGPLGVRRHALLALAAELEEAVRRRRFLKVPDPTRPEFPTRADYMLVLERIPLWAEKGWRELPEPQPGVAVFGQGGHEENSLRSLGNILFAYAFLATSADYDATVSGVGAEHLRERVLQGLRYMARSHVTGDLKCLDGKAWGDHWQSAWWTAKMAAAAQLLWSHLGPAERALVERVVSHEADRHLPRKAPGGEFGNTRSEENAWDSEVLVWAAGLFPAHPHAPSWEAKAREFMVNTLSVQADRQDERLVDGRPLRQQVYTVNVHDDFTIENHGAYQFCYMACPLHSLSWDYYAYGATGRVPPAALFHHFRDVWGVIRDTSLYDGRFAYLSGKDWARYVYGLYFIMPALAVLQHEFGDGEARLLERDRLRWFEWEQRQHGDGGMFSGRFTGNTMTGWPHEYETDAMALLALTALLHGERRPVAAPSPTRFQQSVAGVRMSPACAWLYARSPRCFTSFSWRMLEAGWSIGLFVPAGGDHLVEWGRNNLCGTFRLGDAEARHGTVQHSEQAGECSVATTGRFPVGGTASRPAIVQTLTFAGLPEYGLAALIDRALATDDLTLAGQRPLNLHLANDLFNGNRRTVHSSRGGLELPGVGGTPARHEIDSPWLNVDQMLGVLADGGPWTIHDNTERNAPWGSLLFELIVCAEESAPRPVRAGAVIRDAVFVLLATDAAGTAEAARSLERRSARGEPVTVIRVRAPTGEMLTIAANHGEHAVALSSLALPGRTARQILPLSPPALAELAALSVLVLAE